MQKGFRIAASALLVIGLVASIVPAVAQVNIGNGGSVLVGGCGTGFPCAISQGGTGATTAPVALANLGGWMLPIFVGTAPSGACTPNNQTAYLTNSVPYLQYTCISGTWVQTGGGGGGGVLYPSPTANSIPKVTNATAPGTLGNSCAIDNGTTFACTTEPANFAGYQVGGSPFGTANLADWTDAGIANGNCPVWNSGTSKWTPGTCGSAGVTQIIPGTNISVTPAGGTGAVTVNSLGNGAFCDIRSQGATLNTQDIGPYIQDCINAYYPYAAGTTQTILLPCGNGNLTTSCWWAHPSALTFPHGGPVKIELSGYLGTGEPLLTNSTESFYGIGPPGSSLQFQPGSGAAVFAPQLYGTLGTACATPNASCVITPVFGCTGTAQNSTYGNCNIGYLPAGSAITVSGTTTVTGASASAVNTGSGYRAVTLTLASSPRYVALETITVSGCSDSTLNISGGMLAEVTFLPNGTETVIYYQSTTVSNTTATGCSITSFDEDKYESLRLWCSNGTNNSVRPSGASACSTGQWTVWPIHAHSSSDQWGAVGVAETFAEQGGQQFHDINIANAVGMSYWSEQGSNLDLLNVGMNPEGGFPMAGGMEMTASYVQHLTNTYYETNSPNPVTCAAGGCAAVPYPYGLRCDSEGSGINTGGAGPQGGGCASSFIHGGAYIGGGIKIDGQGVNSIAAFPNEIGNMLWEQVSSSAVTIDNRTFINTSQCLDIHDNALQDNVTQQTTYYLGYTNSEPPSLTCYKAENLSNALTPYLTNNYFNASLTVDDMPVMYFQALNPIPGVPNVGSSAQNNTVPSKPWNDGREITSAVRGSGAGFGPQVLPFGSIAINNSPTSWSSTAYPNGCASPNTCTVVTTNVVCPDGPQATSAMQCAEVDGPGQAFNIGTWTGGTYAGDQFEYGCYVRPGAAVNGLQGLQNQDGFYLITNGTDAYDPEGPVSSTNNSYPTWGFGALIQKLSWYPEMAIWTVVTGESASHTVNFKLSSGDGNAGVAQAGFGNQFSNCRWAFIPGPNNPSYTGVTPDEVAFARDNQYRGAVPSGGVTAGVAATLEPVSMPSVTIPGAAAGSYVKADGTGSGTPAGAGTVTDGSGTSTANQFATSTTTTHQIQYTALTGYVYGNGASAPTASTTIPAANGGTGQAWGSSSGIPGFDAGTASLFNTSCSGASNALTWNSSTESLGCNTISGGSISLPQTISGTVTSGGIPYFSSATQMSSSAAGTAHSLMLWGGAGNAPTASTTTDNGTTFAIADNVTATSTAIGTVPVTAYGFSSGQTADLEDWYNYNGGTKEASISASGLGTFAGGITITGASNGISSTGSSAFLNLSGSGSYISASQINATTFNGPLVVGASGNFGSSASLIAYTNAAWNMMNVGYAIVDLQSSSTGYEVDNMMMANTFQPQTGTVTLASGGILENLKINPTFGNGSTFVNNALIFDAKLAPTINESTSGTGFYCELCSQPVETSVSSGVTNYFLGHWKSGASETAANMVFDVAENGAMSSISYAGTGTTSITAGSAISNFTSVGCASGHVCDSISGDWQFTGGDATTTAATILTINLPVTRTNDPNCSVHITSSSGKQPAAVSWTTTTSTIVIAENSTGITTDFLTAGTWDVIYVCGGN